MLLACQGQLRLAPSGHVIGIDMNAALRLASARGHDLAVLSELLPAAEAGLLKGRSGGASTKHLYRSGTSSTDDHILWLASGVPPNLRHDSNTGTVTITSSVSTNDTAWHTLVATWRPRRLELYLDGISRASSTAANTNTSDAFGIYRWGWGWSPPTRTSTATSP